MKTLPANALQGSSEAAVGARRVPLGSLARRFAWTMFDSEFYQVEAGISLPSREAAFLHFWRDGEPSAISPCLLFDPDFYAKKYSCADTGTPAIVQYIAHGIAAGHDPSPFFSNEYYLNRYSPGNLAARWPLAHFLEGAGQFVSPVPFFDCAFYLRQNPDVEGSGWHPLLHFLRFGAREGRDPSPHFSSARYAHLYGRAEAGFESARDYLISGPRKTTARALDRIADGRKRWKIGREGTDGSESMLTTWQVWADATQAEFDERLEKYFRAANLKSHLLVDLRFHSRPAREYQCEPTAKIIAAVAALNKRQSECYFRLCDFFPFTFQSIIILEKEEVPKDLSAVREEISVALRHHGVKMILDADDKVITPFIKQRCEWEPFETAVFLSQLDAGSVVVDVGANVGYYTLLASKAVGETGKVIAVEPDPTSFALLERNVQMNAAKNVTLIRKGLSDRRATGRLYLDSENKGDHRLFLEDAIKPSVSVELVPYNEIDASASAPSLIKIDVQGWEAQALSGFPFSSYETMPTLLMEFWPSGLEAAGSDPLMVLRFVQGLGYSIFEVENSERLVERNHPDLIVRSLGLSPLKFANLFLVEQKRRSTALKKLAGAEIPLEVNSLPRRHVQRSARNHSEKRSLN